MGKAKVLWWKKAGRNGMEFREFTGTGLEISGSKCDPMNRYSMMAERLDSLLSKLQNFPPKYPTEGG